MSHAAVTKTERKSRIRSSGGPEVARADAALTLEVAIQVAEMFGGLYINHGLPPDRRPAPLLVSTPEMQNDIYLIWLKCAQFKRELPRIPSNKVFQWLNNGAFANMFKRGPVSRVS